MVERPLVLEPDEIRAAGGPDGVGFGIERLRDPGAVRPEHVVGVGIHRGRNVRRQRPRRRRPDRERFAVAILQRELDEERRVLELLVLAGEELVLGDRRSTARAPDRRAVSLVEPATFVGGLQEAPDVLDVGVRERVVVVVPVHPHAEAARLLCDHLRELRDPLLAALGELREAVLLDLALRVQPERLLDLHFDPETLAVETVLVPLVESPKRLVALKDILQRPSPGVVHAHGVVGGDRPVDEAEARPAAVQLTKRGERSFVVPPLENLELERIVIRFVRKR